MAIAIAYMDEIRQCHLDEPCPKCKAKSGDKCRTPKGKTMYKPHADRIHNGNILFQERYDSGYYDKKEEAGA